MGEERQFRDCQCCFAPPYLGQLNLQFSSTINTCALNQCGYRSPNSVDLCPGNDNCNYTYYRTIKTTRIYTNGTSITTSTTSGYTTDCTETTTTSCSGNCTGTVVSTLNECQDPRSSFSDRLRRTRCDNTREDCLQQFPDPYDFVFGFPNNGYEDPCLTIPATPLDFCTDYYGLGGSSTKYDMSDKSDKNGRFLFRVESKSKYRLLHNPTPTCYLRVWLIIRTTQLIPTFNPTGFGGGCFGWSLEEGETTEEIIDFYEWFGSGRPCFEKIVDQNGNFSIAGCENTIISSETGDLIAGDFQLKTANIYKYSFIEGYEPSAPNLSGYPQPV
jgi:hypothetical protein